MWSQNFIILSGGPIGAARAIFINEPVESGWHPEYLPGPMSPSLHETVRSWFGPGLRFSEPWLVESITRYLQVVRQNRWSTVNVVFPIPSPKD